MFQDIFESKSYGENDNSLENVSTIVQKIIIASPFLQSHIKITNSSESISANDDLSNIMKVKLKTKGELNEKSVAIEPPNVFTQVLPFLQQVVMFFKSKDEKLSDLSNMSSKFISFLINSTTDLNKTLHGKAFHRELAILYTFDALDNMVDNLKTNNKKDSINVLVEVAKSTLEEIKNFVVINEVEKYIPIISNITANNLLKVLEYGKNIFNSTDVVF